MIFETFRQAIQNVWSNKLRTFLTMLGIIIGVMAVIVIVGLGNGMTKSMRDSFSALGTNTLSIQVWGYGSRTVSVEEMYDICQRHSNLIKAVSPQVNFSGKASGTLKIGTTSYRWSNMSGVDENFTEMKNYQIVRGAACNIWICRTTSRSASSAITSTAWPLAATAWDRPSRSVPTSSAL